jgi:GAF domain-containing protein
MEADDCFIVLWDEDHGRLLPGSASQRVRERAGSFRFDQDADALTRVVLSVNIPLAIEDFRQSPYVCPSLVDLFEAQSVLGISLNANERRYGVLVISFAKPHHFSERQIYLYEQAAGLVALTIAKAWSLETARQRADEAETLRQAGAVVAATLQQDEAIQRILEQLMRVVPYDSASVQLLGNGYLEIVGGLGWRDQSSVLGLRFPIPGDNPNTRVVQTRKPYILGDALLHHKTFGQAPHNHIHSWMGVPLIVHDQVIGMLAVDNMQVNYFTEDQARLVSAFADQVAIVMENARLYKAARQAS